MDVLAAIYDQRGTTPPARAGADTTLIATGYLVTPPTSKNLCTVSVNGSSPIQVPAVPGVYTNVSTVRILLHHGAPVQVLGPAGAIPVGGSGLPTPPPATTTTVTRASRVVLPQASGTWRVPRAAWGRWGEYADVYQASASDSGQLWGLATYGDQVPALGASTITRAVLSLVQMGTSGISGAWTAVVQGSPAGSLPGTAPTYTGGTVSVSMPGRGYDNQVRTVELTAAMREALRTGSIKGLGLTGSTYGITKGAGRHGQAWALALDYEVTT